MKFIDYFISGLFDAWNSKCLHVSVPSFPPLKVLSYPSSLFPSLTALTALLSQFPNCPHPSPIPIPGLSFLSHVCTTSARPSPLKLSVLSQTATRLILFTFLPSLPSNDPKLLLGSFYTTFLPPPSLPLAFCPIPTVMDYLKSNYIYWKSQCAESPSYSSSEEEPEVSQLTVHI